MEKADVVILKKMQFRMRRYAGCYALLNTAAAMAMTKSGEMGLALISEGGEVRFWGLVTPHTVVQFYRAMQFLDEVNVVADWLLSACYYAAARRPSAHGQDRIEFLEFNGVPDVRAILKRIHKKPIPQEDIDAILEMANEYNVSVAGWELEEAVRARDIQRSDLVDMFIHREHVMQSQYQVRSYLAKKMMPLPKEISFQEFCRKVGLDNICDSPMGMYGFDWGHYSLDEIDERIVHCSLEEVPFFLFCSQNPGGSDGQFGPIGVPVFDTDDGRVIMEKVGYSHDDDMMDVEITPELGTLGKWIKLCELEKKHPKFVGVAQYDKDDGCEITEIRLIKPRNTPLRKNQKGLKMILQRLLDKRMRI